MLQGKHSIPVHQQRLTFACNHSAAPEINLFSWNCANPDKSATANGPFIGDFVKCLQSWQAILRSEKCNIARLLNPEVFGLNNTLYISETGASVLSCLTLHIY
eukprot:Gb_26394 [translate_table: standard]